MQPLRRSSAYIWLGFPGVVMPVGVISLGTTLGTIGGAE